MKIFNRLILKIFRHFGYEIFKSSYKPHLFKNVSLQPSGRPKGRVLLAYLLDPFIAEDRDSLISHTHYWESFQIAEIYQNLGYQVDVIDYRNDAFVPKRKYDLFISARSNFNKIAERLNKECYKVVHLDTAHWMFNNQAVYTRYLALQKRRKTTVKLKKIFGQTWAIECADCATILGNETTSGTYKYAGKAVFELPVPTCKTYPFPEKKNFDKARNSFMWMGSDGLINKGLDLVIEVFADLPEFQLYVCGPIEADEDFRALYEHELYHLDNIKTLGWMDITSDKFVETTTKCSALIYPSCAEGQAGAVATCMQAALIPIVSRESGFLVNGLGVLLQECTQENIKQAVIEISQTAPEILNDKAKKVWQYARNTHSRENYRHAYQRVAETIVYQLMPQKKRGMVENKKLARGSVLEI